MSDELRAAAERIVNAARYWTGCVAVGPGTLQINEDDVMRVARSCLERERDIDQLRSYIKHKVSCPASASMWAQMQSGPCDCGLDALLEALGIEVVK